MNGTAAALDIDNLSVTLGGREVVSSATARFQAGRFVVLAGPNGAGKTSLLRAMAGLTAATGAVSLTGQPLATFTARARARQIAYLPQGHQAHWPLAARDIVALGRYPHGVSDPAAMSPADQAAVDAAMARTGTLPFADRPITALSGGERARVMLARVLAVEAPVVLADEPTAALDPRYQLLVLQDLKAESERGRLVIMVTHDIWLASRFADEMVLMHEGRIVVQAPPLTALSDDNLQAVYGVSASRHTVDGETVLTPRGLA